MEYEMQSLRSRFFIALLKHRHLFRLKLKRDIIDWDTSIEDLRKQVERSASMFGKLPDEITIEPAGMSNPSGEFVKKAGAPDDHLILYFHGGGYVMGSDKAHRRVVSKFVMGSGVNALCFDYRLAPEHPFPAALDDSVNAYRWLIAQQFDPSKILFAGDSAGAGLLLAALLYLRDRGTPLPAAAVALSPWTDLACTGASYKNSDPLAEDGTFEVYGAYYAGAHDLKDPYVSPLYGELSGLPPIYISVGENESMLDDSVRFAEKADVAGVDVTLNIGRGMVHCYPTLSPLFPEAKETMSNICQYIRSKLLKENHFLN